MKIIKKQYIAMGISFIVFVFLLCTIRHTGNRANTPVTNATDRRTENLSPAASSFSETSLTEKNAENITGRSSSDTSQTVAETSSAPETTSQKIDFQRPINFDAEFPFLIKINRIQNWTIVYGLDDRGYYSVPYKIFLCSTGLRPADTPTGVFKISDKYDWRLMVDHSYAQYAIRINGQIMLHSVPYYSPDKSDLEVEEYNKLGSPASLGCIRYNVESIKWIYDNCPAGTKVVIYDSVSERPLLNIPKLKKAKSSGKKAGWDPTDPDKKNPWN